MPEMVSGRWWANLKPVTIRSIGGVISDVEWLENGDDLPILGPAYVDSHCHILPKGLDLAKLNLGACSTREEILDRLRDRERELDEGEWLLAVHYDQTKFSDGNHITRWELDSVSSVRPILLRHVSGHASVANSAALAAAGIDESVPNPSGGEFCRNESGELTGVLLEDAHEAVTKATPKLTLDQMEQAILRSAEHMRGFGIRTASDMMTGRFDLEKELIAYQRASDTSGVMFRLYVQWRDLFGPRAIDSGLFKELCSAMDPAKCRVAGVKIFADGAIGSRTAAIYGRFENSAAPEGTDEGQLMYAPERLKSMVVTAAEAGYQVSVHAIGDRATDLVLDSFEATNDPRRHRLEHAMILSDAQIERLAKVNCHVTMQPEFLHRFGHAYLMQLGAERASRLKRFRSVKDAGLRLSFSSDAPIVLGDPAIGVRTASSRPSGFDPSENLTWVEAFEAYTHFGALANEDEGLRELKVGDRAAFQPILAQVM